MRGFAPGLAALGAMIALLAAAFLWQPGLDSLFDDSVSYLLMAQRFTPFHALDAAVAAAAVQEKYPPLFPLVLALTGGAYDWRIAHLVVALCFAASVVLLGLYARRLLGSPIVAWLAAAAFASLPGAWLIAKGILSEYPYIALSFGTLLVCSRLDARSMTPRHALALGALLAATILTRTIGVALAAAIVVSELWRFARTRDRPRLVAIAIALCVAATLAGVWYALRGGGTKDPYVGAIAVVASGEPMEIALWLGQLVLANVQALRDAWLHALLIYWGDYDSPRVIVTAVLGVLGLGSALYRAGEGRVDGLYVAFFLAILLVWPFSGQIYRLAFPVVPLLLVHALWGLGSLLQLRVDPTRAMRWTAIGALLPFAASVPAVVFYIGGRAQTIDASPGLAPVTSIAEFYRIPSGPAAEDVARRQVAVMGDLERLRTTLPAQARIMWYTPGYIALLARHEGVALRRPANRADFLGQLRETRADYLYLADVQPRDSLWHEGSPFYPMYLARGVAQIEWIRQGPNDDTRAILLKVDPAALAADRGKP